MDNLTIIQKGDASGNGMVAKFRLPSGLEIITLPTKNFYGGHWDLGPTWNYAVMTPKGYKQQFPAKCWHCIMPASFFEENCLGYHRVLQNLDVECIGDGMEKIDTNISSLHLPGHSPDSLAVMLGDEALIVGDVVLPDITPWPTRLEQYREIANILAPLYPDAGALFGLNCYLNSLRELKRIADRRPDIMVFPAHRVYYHDQWQDIHLSERLHQLVEHHIQRCGAILDILATGKKGVDEIVRLHFNASLLAGPGEKMAANEIISHTELMLACGDLKEVEKHHYAATGSQHFEQHITRNG